MVGELRFCKGGGKKKGKERRKGEIEEGREEGEEINPENAKSYIPGRSQC